VYPVARSTRNIQLSKEEEEKKRSVYREYIKYIDLENELPLIVFDCPI